MGAQEKVNRKLKARLAEIWASTKGVEMSTDECLELLKRIRTYYMKVWEAQNEQGEVALTSFCKTMIEDVNKILLVIETERVQADVEIARTIVRTPLLLAPAEQTDLMVMLDGGSLEVGDA